MSLSASIGFANAYSHKGHLFQLYHLQNSEREHSQLLGLVEKPNIPPTVEELHYKIFVAGRAGIGKTFLISWLSGIQISSTYVATPGIQMTVVHCPLKICHHPEKYMLFNLHFWEARATGKRTISDLTMGCPSGVDAVLLLFSFSERENFKFLPQLMEQFENPDRITKPCFIAIGNGWNVQEFTAVTQDDVSHFESNWKVPVLTLPHFFSKDLCEKQIASQYREVVLTFLCEQLWLRDKNLISHGIT